MSQEKNKAVVRAYAEAFGRGDFDTVKSLCTSDAVIQGVLGTIKVDGALPLWRQLHEAYEIQLDIEEIIAEGDFVAARFMEHGTFRKAFQAIEPTGKSYRVVAMEWFRIQDGKIAQRWGSRDSGSIIRQLGMEAAFAPVKRAED